MEWNEWIRAMKREKKRTASLEQSANKNWHNDKVTDMQKEKIKPVQWTNLKRSKMQKNHIKYETMMSVKVNKHYSCICVEQWQWKCLKYC